MPVKVFFSYAHEDEPLLNKLKSHLQPLRRQGLIDVWHDRDIHAGTEWEQEINEHLNDAEIILLLISPDFMNSEYCYSKEMQRALERHKQGKTKVIPINLRPVDWHGAPFNNIQSLPRNGKAVTSSRWNSADEAFFDVAKGIREVVEDLLSHTVTPAVTPNNMPDELKPVDGIIQTQAIDESWSSAGALGEIVGRLADAQQWGQAESMARSIENTSLRSQLLHKLVVKLIKAQQWERAEAITRTIENRNHKDKALIELVTGLAHAEQWTRAEAMARSIVNIPDRLRILNELSRRLANAGEMGRATLLAYEASHEIASKYYVGSEVGNVLQSQPLIQPKRSNLMRPVLIFLIAIVSVTLISMLIYFVKSHNPIPLFIFLGIIGIIIIGAIIVTTLRRNKYYDP